MASQVAAALLGVGDHAIDPVGLALEPGDLAIEPLERVLQDGHPLVRVGRVLEPGAVALAGLLVDQELADLGQAEPGVVPEPADEAQALQVVVVEEAVRALGSGGRLEEPQLLVVANGAGRQADLGRDLRDPEEARAWFRRSRSPF